MSAPPEQARARELSSRGGGTPWGLLDIAAAVGSGFLLGGVLGALALFLLRAYGAGPSNSAQLTVFGVTMYGAILLGVWLLVVRRRSVGWADVGFRRVGVGALLSTLPALVALLAANVVVTVVMGLFLGEIENPQERDLAPSGSLTLIDYLLLLPAVSVAAPIVEELVFRGLLYGYLRGRTRVWAAVLLSAAVFAVVHVYPVILPPLFVTGVALALLRERYDSILPTILLHALLNAVATTTLYLTLG